MENSILNAGNKEKDKKISSQSNTQSKHKNKKCTSYCTSRVGETLGEKVMKENKCAEKSSSNAQLQYNQQRKNNTEEQEINTRVFDLVEETNEQ